MKINLYNEHEVNEYFCNKLADNWERINIKIINNKIVTGISSTQNDSKVSLIGVKDKPGVAAAIFKPLSKNLINWFEFNRFELILHNQARMLNTLGYAKIPHDYIISPCLNFLLSNKD